MPMGSVNKRKGTLDRTSVVMGDFAIPCAIAGSGRQVLICVNGLQQTMAAWHSLVRRMAATDYRTVLFDFPNQGSALAATRSRSVTLREQVDILDAVAAHVSPSAPVALIGGSWGALVAAAYAALHPQRVCKVLLGSFQTRPTAHLREVARRGCELARHGRLDELANLFLTDFGRQMPSAAQAAIRQQFRNLRPEQVQQMYDQGELLLEQTDLSSVVDLQQISADTLVVNGEDDPLVDSRDAARIVQRLPRARLHVEPGAGHFLHFERPAILDIYIQFLTGWVEPAGPAASTVDRRRALAPHRGDLVAT